jgi:hypothetical protein
MKCLVTLAIFFITCTSMYAQGKADPRCPIIDVSGPDHVPVIGQLISFSARIDTKGQTLDLRYQWNVSHGTIFKGEGTQQIFVLSDVVSLTATLKVLGLPPGCTDVFSESINYDPPPQPVKLTELSDLDNWDGFAETLQKALHDYPSNQLYFVMSHVDRNGLESTRRRVQNSVQRRIIHDARITFVDVPSDHNSLQIWSIPPGATVPLFDEGKEPKPICPNISIIAPANVTAPGEVMKFVASINGVVPHVVSFYWMVRGGDIVGGQGTPELSVRQPNRTGTILITAALEVTGLPSDCRNTASESISTSVDGRPTLLRGRNPD